MNKLDKSVREPAVAGQFYEADPVVLDSELSAFFANCAEKFSHSGVRAVISPHAGYLYSGQTAAEVFALLKSPAFNYRRAVIIAPSHRVPFSGLAACSYSAYSTPLGTLDIDTEILESLCRSKVIEPLDAAHKHEHALEVQLPFLQKILQESSPPPDNFKIVPLICGQLDEKIANLAAEALLPYWNSETLWIISSDFTHYGHSFSYLPFSKNIPENLEKLDLGAVEKITALDFQGFSDYIADTGATVCGANPIKLLLKTIELSSSDDKVTSRLVDYTTSGKLTGDYSHCVSYAGIAFFEK